MDDRDGVIVANLFGPLTLHQGDRTLGPRDLGSVKPKQILEILLLARGRPVPKDRLGDLLWGEALPRNVTATLETYVSVLRNRLYPGGMRGHEVIATEFGAYRINTEMVRLDLDAYDDLVRGADEADPEAARALLEKALGLVRGEVLEDEPYASWVERSRERYRTSHVEVLTSLCENLLVADDARRSVGYADRAVDLERSDERATRALMLAHYACGRQKSALHVFRRLGQHLAEGFGVAPLPETTRLAHAIRCHADSATLVAELFGVASTVAPSRIA